MNFFKIFGASPKVTPVNEQFAAEQINFEGEMNGVSVTAQNPGERLHTPGPIDSSKVTNGAPPKKRKITTATAYSAVSDESDDSDVDDNASYSFIRELGSDSEDEAPSRRNPEAEIPPATAKSSIGPTTSTERLSSQRVTLQQVEDLKITPQDVKNSLKELSALTDCFKTDVEQLSKQSNFITEAEFEKNNLILEAAICRYQQIKCYDVLIKRANTAHNKNSVYQNNYQDIQNFNLSNAELEILEKIKSKLEEIFGTLTNIPLSNSGNESLSKPNKNLGVTWRSIKEGAFSGWLNDLHDLFQQAASKFPENKFYSEALANLKKEIEQLREATAGKNNVSNIDSNQAERIRIQNVLANPTELQKIITSNPEDPHSCVNLLDAMLRKDPALIIIKAESQESGLQQKEEKKATWSIVRLWQWSNRSSADKNRYRNGILAARAHVGSTYGPCAIKRFDAHFALRYRKGSPLTVRALNQFVLYEQNLIATEEKFSNAVVPLDLSKDTSLTTFSETILDRAKAEFDLRYYCENKKNTLERPEGMNQIKPQDKAVLFANFYQHYLQRPVVIEEEVPKTISGEKGYSGFFTTRWNALWTSLFFGDNSQANQQLQMQLTDWIINQVPASAQPVTRKDIDTTIQGKLKSQKKLTLQDLDDLIDKAKIASQENNTWVNFWYYRVYAPVIGGAAKAVGGAAAVGMLAGESSIGKGAAKAAALGAALYALDDRPGMQLSVALAAWWATKNPTAASVGESSIIGTITSAAKHAAIFYAGLHFPPLLLLHLL